MTNPLPNGTLLKNNTYQIVGVLGAGGFGAVYLAEDTLLGKKCAIKQSFDSSPNARAQFEIEARILANLNHPHLPRVTDNFVETSDSTLYLVMEYVEGRDLGQLLESQGPLPEQQVVAWMDQVLDAVAYLHDYQPRPIVHRDIKPDNIRLLPDNKTVRLVDFGIAKIGSPQSRTHQFARGVTPGFGPPEQYGTGGTGPFSDVYALGATLYNLLTGVVPPDAVDIAHSGAMLQPPRTFNPQLSAGIEQVILTAMQIEPRARFQNAHLMRQALKGGGPAPQLTAICPNCGAAIRQGSKFCKECGQSTIPVTPFIFQKSGYRASSIAELVRGCDSYWKEALNYFQGGHFENWLPSLGPEGQNLAAESRSLRAMHSDTSASLEAFLQKAAPTRSLPVLTALPDKLDFDLMRLGDSKVLSVRISNSGRGYLYGKIQVQPAEWLNAQPESFGCLAGETLMVDIEVHSAALSGSELGVDYSGSITLLSNRGQVTIPASLKVVDEPRLHIEPLNIDLGRLQWGESAAGQIRISNAGSGILNGSLAASEPWLKIGPSGNNFSLQRGRILPVDLSLDTSQFKRMGQYRGHIRSTQGQSSAVTIVTVNMAVPYPLDPVQPQSTLSTLKDLVNFCDQNWETGLELFEAGRLEAFLIFIGEDHLAKEAASQRQQPNKDAALETTLRAAGAKPPTDLDTNVDEVLNQLGFGFRPSFGRKPETVTLTLKNTSPRGYMHGRVCPAVPWLSIEAPDFNCRPGQAARIKVRADHNVKKGGKRFSLETDIFDIELD